jgi:cytochrome c
LRLLKDFYSTLAFVVTILSSGLAAHAQVQATQSLDLSITDPDEIAAVCGGDAAAGEPLFVQTCAACHSLTPEDGSRPGPHLDQMFGRLSGSVEGFTYASTLPDELLIWERETLHAFLGGLEPVVEGHPVIEDEQTAIDILTYLRVETRAPPPALEDIVVPAALLADPGDVPYGEFLAGDCRSCHVDGAEQGSLEQIATMPRDAFLTRMYQFKLRADGSETMQLQAARLSDEELAALAAYFQTLSN